MKIKKYQNPNGSLKPAQVFLNGKWVDLESHGDGNLSAGGRQFKVKTKPTSATGDNEVVVTPNGATSQPATKDEGYKSEYRSAFHGNDIMYPVKKTFEWIGSGLYNTGQALERAASQVSPYGSIRPTNQNWAEAPTPVTDATFQYVLPTMAPSRWVGTLRTGMAPWNPENPGLGNEDVNLLFDLGATPAAGKLLGKGYADAAHAYNYGKYLDYWIRQKALSSPYRSQSLGMAIDVANKSGRPLHLRNYGFLTDPRFYADIDKQVPMFKLREQGEYPLTFAERRNFVTDSKKAVNSGIDHAYKEAAENLTAGLRTKLKVVPRFSPDSPFFDPNMTTVKFVPRTPQTLDRPKVSFGTLEASKSYGSTPWAEQGSYWAAFQNPITGLHFPFRVFENSLRTNPEISIFQRKGAGLGAHEARHTIQEQFKVPLTEIRPIREKAYNRYTSQELSPEFRKLVNDYIKDAGTMGDWAGSLAEMDSELSGWSAKYNLPRYSYMTPKQKAVIHDLFQRRFGGNTDYTNYGEVSSLLRQNPNWETATQYAKTLDESRIGQIIRGLEDLGYRKQGGKLDFLKKGNKIHIKKKNRGKFTDYCGGKVTNACISRAKASGNPTLVKRATFAANARKWKH